MPYTYTVTRNLDGTGADHWYAGEAIFNTGQTGSGFIDLYSLSGILSGFGPTIVGNVRTGTAFDQIEPRWAAGNLRNLYGYGASDVYGFAAGRYATDSTWVSVDATHGFRISRGTTVLGQWAMDGSITVGEVASGRNNIRITSSSLEVRNNVTNRIVLDASGNITVGTVASGQGNVVISDGSISIRVGTTERIGLTSGGILTIKDSSGNAIFTFNAAAGAEFTRPLTLATSGGIYQGTGSFSSPTTGLKIWNDSGFGRIAGYNAGTLQWYAGTDGRLYAGGGNVVIDSKGITLLIPETESAYLSFRRGNIYPVDWMVTYYPLAHYLNSTLFVDVTSFATSTIARCQTEVRSGTSSPAYIDLISRTGSSTAHLTIVTTPTTSYITLNTGGGVEELVARDSQCYMSGDKSGAMNRIADHHIAPTDTGMHFRTGSAPSGYSWDTTPPSLTWSYRGDYLMAIGSTDTTHFLRKYVSGGLSTFRGKHITARLATGRTINAGMIIRYDYGTGGFWTYDFQVQNPTTVDGSIRFRFFDGPNSTLINSPYMLRFYDFITLRLYQHTDDRIYAYVVGEHGSWCIFTTSATTVPSSKGGYSLQGVWVGIFVWSSGAWAVFDWFDTNF